MTDSTPVQSPCINVCTMNAGTGLCEGCWRTLDEIAAWGMASEAEKKIIWQKIDQRMQQQNQFDSDY